MTITVDGDRVAPAAVQTVLNGSARVAVEQSDAIAFLNQLPADSVDLVFFSPPYEQARLYLENGANLGVSRKTDAWVAWMVDVYRAATRVCKGLVAGVVAGQTRNYRWSAGPALLMAELHRAGLNLRNPPIFRRVGIPGSGGPDWLRGDYEWIVCTSRPGKLPWSDNTACGHPPKYAPGGEMSHRRSDGERVNQWGGHSGVSVSANGEKYREEPSHRVKRRVTSGHKDGDTPNGDSYDPPVLANPGNVIECLVGGGVMGNKLCHENEAPFPEALAEFFVKSYAPPGGLVCDPFSGSGTTGAMAVKWQRRFVGCDLRASQVQLARRRIGEQAVEMFV